MERCLTWSTGSVMAFPPTAPSRSCVWTSGSCLSQRRRGSHSGRDDGLGQGAPASGIEDVSKAVPEETESEDRHEDRASGREDRPWSDSHQVLALVVFHHVSPLRDIERNANPDEGDRREGHKHGPDVERIVHGDWLKDVPDDMTNQESQSGYPRAFGSCDVGLWLLYNDYTP